MKHTYYLFSTEKPIEKCGECPCVDPSGLGYWCNNLKTTVKPKELSQNCPLIPIKGKVEQN